MQKLSHGVLANEVDVFSNVRLLIYQVIITVYLVLPQQSNCLIISILEIG